MYPRLRSSRSPVGWIAILCAVCAPKVALAEKYAFVIGIDEYTHFSSLHAAVSDATDIIRVLSLDPYGYKITVSSTVQPALQKLVNDGKFPGEIFATIDSVGTNRDEILDELVSYQQEIDQDDELIVYFAGHGYRADRKTYWLLPDVNVQQIHQAIEVDDMMTIVEKIQTHRKLLILDHCYAADTIVAPGFIMRGADGDGAGAAAVEGESGESAPKLVLRGGDALPELVPVVTADEGNEVYLPMILAAAKEGAPEIVGPRPQGVFTKYLIETLERRVPRAELELGDAQSVSLQIIGDYLTKKLQTTQRAMFWQPLGATYARDWIFISAYETGAPSFLRALGADGWAMLVPALGLDNYWRLVSAIEGRQAGYEVLQQMAPQLVEVMRQNRSDNNANRARVQREQVMINNLKEVLASFYAGS
jgi:hypothetical protein